MFVLSGYGQKLYVLVSRSAGTGGHWASASGIGIDRPRAVATCFLHYRHPSQCPCASSPPHPFTYTADVVFVTRHVWLGCMMVLVFSRREHENHHARAVMASPAHNSRDTYSLSDAAAATSLRGGAPVMSRIVGQTRSVGRGRGEEEEGSLCR